MNDPRYPNPWTDDTPLEILGDVDGFDPYNSADRIANFRLTPEPGEEHLPALLRTQAD